MTRLSQKLQTHSGIRDHLELLVKLVLAREMEGLTTLNEKPETLAACDFADKRQNLLRKHYKLTPWKVENAEPTALKNAVIASVVLNANMILSAI